MGADSKISWTDATWNVFLGCSRVSPGCAHCYAIKDAWRMQHNPNVKVAAAYAGLTEMQPNGQLDWTGDIRFVEERLLLPLRWTKPKRIFTNSLSDVFHEKARTEDIDRFFAVMMMCQLYRRGHVFQVLTKRPAAMAAYVNDVETPPRVQACASALILEHGPFAKKEGFVGQHFGWPLPNVWLGTSVENQRAADERLWYLMRAKAAVRFLSCEPLLGLVDLHGYLHPKSHLTDGLWHDSCAACDHRRRVGGTGVVDQIIVGGESGAGARKMELEWARLLQQDCAWAGINFHFKQLGSVLAAELGTAHPKGEDPDDPNFPPDLRVRDEPAHDLVPA